MIDLQHRLPRRQCRRQRRQFFPGVAHRRILGLVRLRRPDAQRRRRHDRLGDGGQFRDGDRLLFGRRRVVFLSGGVGLLRVRHGVAEEVLIAARQLGFPGRKQRHPIGRRRQRHLRRRGNHPLRSCTGPGRRPHQSQRLAGGHRPGPRQHRRGRLVRGSRQVGEQPLHRGCRRPLHGRGRPQTNAGLGDHRWGRLRDHGRHLRRGFVARGRRVDDRRLRGFLGGAPARISSNKGLVQGGHGWSWLGEMGIMPPSSCTAPSGDDCCGVEVGGGGSPPACGGAPRFRSGISGLTGAWLPR